MILESGDYMGKHVCSCYKVSKDEIKKIIKNENIEKYKELKKYSKAGGKGCCEKDLKKLVKKYS
jgi:bacterioferritin-associated ferredoxin